MLPTRTVRAALAGALALALAVPLPAGTSGQSKPVTRGHGSAFAAPEGLAQTNRVIVRWDRPAAASELRQGPRLHAIRAASRTPARFLRVTGSGAAVYDVGEPLAGNGARILEGLARVPGVVSVEPDLWMTASDLPDDPDAAALWGLLGPLDASPWGIDAPAAWPTADGDGVVVAIVDSGVVAHPDLADQVIPGYDMYARDADASDPGNWCGNGQSNWHGTHVAGTVAALANNAIGVFGGAPGVKIQPVRVLGPCGGFASDVADGIRWAAGGSVPGVPANPTPADVINASLGTGPRPACLDESASAIADARSRGAIVVVSAGNFDMEARLQDPANCDGVLAVAATDDEGRRASFSNYGATVDLAAPGIGILSTVNGGTTVPEPGGTYRELSGTSMSAPHVALTAALVRSAYPALSNDAVELSLTASALPVAADATATGCAARGCGAGIVNANRAMSQLAAEAPVVGHIAPSTAYPQPGAAFTIEALAVRPAGVATAEVRVDDGGWLSMSATDGAFGGPYERVARAVAAPMTEGEHAICVRASGASPNHRGEACGTVLVDAGPPSVTAPDLSSASAASGTKVTFTSDTTDGNAVAGTEYRVDEGPWIPMPASDGSYGESSERVGSSVGERVRQVAVGGGPCVVMESGTARCWGNNTLGAIGDGTEVDRHVPVELALVDVQQITRGAGHGCALLGDGTVSCWGVNLDGQAGDGSGKFHLSPVPVAGLTDVTSVSAGNWHTCALRTDDTVWCWGLAIGLGDGSTVSRETPAVVPGLSGVVAISSGGHDPGSTCALLNDGTVRCWGENSAGSLGDGTTETSRTPVSVVGLDDVSALWGKHPCATSADGTVSCWGPNGFGELGVGNTDEHLGPTEVTVVSNIAAIASGESHKCALLADGTVRCWGRNGDAELGDGTQEASLEARTVLNLSNIEDVRSRSQTTCALDSAKAVYCWGWNAFGLLGDGTTELRLAPVRVAGLGPLSAGPHSICVRATDTAGHASNGSACSTLTVPDTTPPTASIEAPAPPVGASFTYGVTFDEPVTGLGAGDFTLAGTAAAGCTIGPVTGSGSAYSVQVGCTGSGSLVLALHSDSVTDLAGNSGPTSDRDAAAISVDRTAPTVTRPAHAIRAGTNVTSGAVFVKLTWSGSDSGAGVKHYDVRLQTDGGAWKTVATSLTSPTRIPKLATGHAYRVSVRATDKVGNVGAWKDGTRFRLAARQETNSTIDYSGSWPSASSSRYWGGKVRTSSTGGHTATTTFTGRSIALVAVKGPDRGMVTVRVNGTLVAKVDLNAAKTQPQRVVWAGSWSSSAQRTIAVRVTGGRVFQRVDVDAFVIAS